MFARQPRWVEALLSLRNIIGTYQKLNARTWTSAIGREADERRALPFRPQMGDGLDRHPLAGLQQRLEIAKQPTANRRHLSRGRRHQAPCRQTIGASATSWIMVTVHTPLWLSSVSYLRRVCGSAELVASTAYPDLSASARILLPP